MKRRALVWGLVVWVVGATSGCWKKEKDALPVLRVQLGSDPVSLDPAQAEDGVSIRVLMNLMEGLYGYDSSGRLRPRLFETVEVSDQFRKYKFQIRDRLRWSDGSPLVPEDIVRGLHYALLPQTPSKLVELLYPIRGAEDFKKKKIQWEQVGIRLVGRQLEIELHQAAPWFPHVLALPIAYPRKENTPFVLGKTPSNGAYFISEYQKGKVLKLQKNRYHDVWSVHDPLRADRVELWMVSDESTAVRLFEQKKLDILTRISPLENKRISSLGFLESFPILAIYYIGFNVRDPWFVSPVMRRAFAAAIQKHEIVQALGGAGVPASGWVPEGVEGFIPEQPLSDEKRQQIFSEAKKWMQRHAIRSPLILAYDQSSVNQMVMEKVQSDVRRNLGVSVQLRASDWKTHVKGLSPLGVSAFRFGWLSPFVDPVANLKAMTSNSLNNYTGWKNIQYDGWVEQISLLPPGEKRAEFLKKAQELLVNQESVIVPIFHYRLFHAFSDRIVPVRVNPLSVFFFHEVKFKESLR